jgi:hypothetical protein
LDPVLNQGLHLVHVQIHDFLADLSIPRERIFKLVCLPKASGRHKVEEYFFTRMPHLHRNSHLDTRRQLSKSLECTD